MDGRPTDRFADLVRGPESVLREHLDEVALLVAAHARPGLDINAYRARLDEIAARCDEPVLAEVTHQVFGVEALQGNDRDYYDPRNSYLDEVLDRRLGIPLTLSIVTLEVARRVGIELEGVGLPGHFLVRLPGELPVLLDPFAGGVLLSEAECVARFRAVQGAAAPFHPSYLEPVPASAIVARMLENLRTVHIQRQDPASLDWVLLLRGLLPGATVAQQAERSGVLAAQGRFDLAADLLDDLALVADGEQAEGLRSKARALRARLN